jgi:lysophospholipase L1-like esterase
MNKTRFIVAGLLALALALAGCSLFAPEETLLTAPAVDAGDTDFTRYVALGNSLTAGYQSGALYQSAQIKGFSALLAAAMGTEYQMPLIEDPGMYGNPYPAGHLAVTFDEDGGAVIAPVPWPGGVMPEFLNSSLPAPYHNLGVPGALTVDLLQAYDATTSAAGDNSYFDIILRNANIDWTQHGGASEDLTAMEQAIMLDPTFVSLWIGNNEILGAATAGNGTPLVDVGTFTYLYETLLGGLAVSLPDADFVVANIPSVTSAAFFTTVPWFVIDSDQNPVDGDPGTEGIQLVGLLAADGTNFQLQAGELVTIKILSYDGDESGTPDLEEGMGIPDAILIGGLMAEGMTLEEAQAALPLAFPLHNTLIPGALTLNGAEVTEITAATTAFNAVIQATADSFDPPIPVVDIHTRFADVAANGYEWNSETYTTEFVTGGMFSLDGVHPADIGYAITADWFMEVINETYGSNLQASNAPVLPRAVPMRGLPSFPMGVPNLP